MQPPYNPYGQQAPYAPPNPYAAPGPQMYRQNVYVPPGASAGPPVGGALRKVKLAVGILQVLALIVGMTMLFAGGAMGDEDGASFVAAGGGLLGLWYLLLFVYGIVNMIWLYGFWSWIPPEQRHTNLWKKYISPGTAVGFMFIPYFNIYWMFVIYLGIADIMERMRVQYPTSKSSAKTLAMLTTVVPMLFFPAGPFLQFFFAKHVEEMAKEMQARMAVAGYPMASNA
ncbi:MAG TPA: hypothetical protein VM580_26100 [Labilithrix sp.]|jgi:hypothetical protein|nr:hypothetical protein [Labilithrix sp.]